MKTVYESAIVSMPAGTDIIRGDLAVPAPAGGTVVFAHGSGSSRHSPRNMYVAEVLNRAGFATLLIDLLTAEEEMVDRTGKYRFNIPLLAERLAAATGWARAHERLKDLPLGYFGASTGAAAALVAAARQPDFVKAIVSRGGRPDLAGDDLGKVAAPTLLIVGEFDRDVMRLNRQAAEAMRAPVEFRIVSGATHLFEEPGALEQVAALARSWFEEKLKADPAA